MNVAELEKLIDQYGTDILRFCRTVSGNPYDADDLYQNTLLIAMQKMKNLDGQRNPKSYLLAITVNLVKARRRNSAVHNRIAVQESYEDLIEKGWDSNSDQNNDPEDKMMHQVLLETIRTAVSELPPKYKIPICLFYASDLSIAEIADCLGIPRGSVKSRLYRGKAMIKKRLEVAGYEG